ncbi:YncE family protein [Acrocarpospora corrugata]|uniref:YncE family protein n=1 Tax=Acrocarpospora corrugata TaxID=35763 RepID=UPI001FE721A5|nr:hypothetical protein [Acrocarpospora corrugata]
MVLATIDVGLNPRGVAFTPGWHHAYVANSCSNTVSVIDVRRRTVTATIPVGLFPYGVAFTPSGRTAYVANSDSDTVSVLDTATGAVTARLRTSAQAPRPLAGPGRPPSPGSWTPPGVAPEPADRGRPWVPANPRVHNLTDHPNGPVSTLGFAGTLGFLGA